MINTNEQVLTSVPKKDNGEMLQVKTIFRGVSYTPGFEGWPAIFLRLGGCNLACWYCDAVYRIQDDEPKWKLQDVIATVATHVVPTAYPLVIITGGEPFRQNILPLVASLLGQGYLVGIETNGTAWHDLRGWGGHAGLHIVCSPKTAKVRRELLPLIKAYKYTLRNGEVDPKDGLPTGDPQEHGREEKPARPHNEWIPVYVEPMSEGNAESDEANMKACIESAQYGRRIALRGHRILGVNG